MFCVGNNMKCDFRNILQNIIDLKSDELNDWESDFVNSLFVQSWPLTDKQKDIILKLNRKYLVDRG